MTRARPAPAPPTLSSARLAYRRPLERDARAIFERYASDETATRYMSFPRHRSIDDAIAFVAWSDAQWSETGLGPYLIHDPSSGELLGSTGLHAGDGPVDAATGYILARDAWGRGYATEALRTMVGLAASLGYRSLEAPCHPDNVASQRVLKKCGFVATTPRDFAFPNVGLVPVAALVFRLAPLPGVADPA